MKKNHWFLRLLALMLVSFTLLTATVMATGAGSADDPLVTLSYLNGRFLPDLLSSVDQKIAARDKRLTDRLSEQIKAEAGASGQSGKADSFTVVTLSNGQVLYGEIGCEVMLRVGTASCVASTSPGLIDETGGGSLDNGGSLVKNHLYMMTISERGVKATAGTTKLLVRGSYRIG